jgi:ABC-type glutathione transport system ATPase component
MFKVLLDCISVTRENREEILLKNIFFELEKGNIYTILGKNGSGKSTFLKSLTELLDNRFYSINGKVLYKDENMFSLSEKELINIRRKEIKYVFQDSVNSFDHLKTIGYHFNLFLPGIKNDQVLQNKTDELLSWFLLPSSEKIFKMYPYELSGGMAQRVTFILALLSEPEIIFLDEPTSGIDAPVVNLMMIKLKNFVQNGGTALMVTQDIELSKSVSNKIALLSQNTLSPFYSPQEFFFFNRLTAEV